MSNQELTVDVLCSLMGMSRTSFYNKLKALTDQAPSDYIRFIRLEQAAQLLKEGQHSITEIAEMTGFCDSKYFREVFKSISRSIQANMPKEREKKRVMTSDLPIGYRKTAIPANHQSSVTTCYSSSLSNCPHHSLMRLSVSFGWFSISMTKPHHLSSRKALE